MNCPNTFASALISEKWAIVIAVVVCSLSLIFSAKSFGQNTGESSGKLMHVGVAQVDITPDKPIHLAAYLREEKSEGIAQRLHAKALAFGSDAEGPSVLITVDLIGVPRFMVDRVTNWLTEHTILRPENVVISATHIHSGPDISTQPDQPVEELARINHYIDELTRKFEHVAIEALHGRKPSLVSWGQGKVEFAKYRRNDGFGAVDHSLPMLKVADPEGNLRAVLVNYACHATTLTGAYNKIHADWVGEARRIIEERHPGAIALVSIGAAGDANPRIRGDVSNTTKFGMEIADEVDRLLKTPLQPLTAAPEGRSKQIELMYAHIPTVEELVQEAQKKRPESPHREEIYLRHVQRALDRMANGNPLPTSFPYPIKTWTFGEDLAMIFLGGEVVADYSLRLKRELGDQRLWVTAYSNNVYSYIASERMIPEGGYEVDYSMINYSRLGYNLHPSRLKSGTEDSIIEAVYDLLPPSFKTSDTQR